MKGPESCFCATLPDVFEDSYLTNVTAVAAFVGDEKEAQHASYYQCLDCGQW